MDDRRGDWIQTFTGRQFWPLDPKVEDIDLLDIAHSLSMQCRYGGHAKRFYSVAEHCVHVSTWVGEEHALWGLMHDASEAYLADVPRPIKPFLTNYTRLEYNLMNMICRRFQLSGEMPARVQEADDRIRFDERKALLGPPPAPWNLELEPLGIELKLWPPGLAEAVFVDTFTSLTGCRIER